MTVVLNKIAYLKKIPINALSFNYWCSFPFTIPRYREIRFYLTFLAISQSLLLMTRTTRHGAVLIRPPPVQ
jgi:hypothetical protein